MNVYFDTSAFLKLFIQEPGSASVATAWNGADLLIAGRLMYAEDHGLGPPAGSIAILTQRDLAELAALPRAAVVVEERHSRLLAAPRIAPPRRPAAPPTRPRRWPRNGPTPTLPRP